MTKKKTKNMASKDDSKKAVMNKKEEDDRSLSTADDDDRSLSNAVAEGGSNPVQSIDCQSILEDVITKAISSSDDQSADLMSLQLPSDDFQQRMCTNSPPSVEEDEPNENQTKDLQTQKDIRRIVKDGPTQHTLSLAKKDERMCIPRPKSEKEKTAVQGSKPIPSTNIKALESRSVNTANEKVKELTSSKGAAVAQDKIPQQQRGDPLTSKSTILATEKSRSGDDKKGKQSGEAATTTATTAKDGEATASSSAASRSTALERTVQSIQNRVRQVLSTPPPPHTKVILILTGTIFATYLMREKIQAMAKTVQEFVTEKFSSNTEGTGGMDQ